MVKVTEIKQTCSFCPSQWEGQTNDGQVVYVRYRWGFLSIRVGNTLDDAVCRGQEIFEDSVGDGMDGFLTYDELRNLTVGKIIWPEVCP
jgi:hypothetical protein